MALAIPDINLQKSPVEKKNVTNLEKTICDQIFTKCAMHIFRKMSISVEKNINKTQFCLAVSWNLQP